MGDFDDLDDIEDEVDIRANRGEELRGKKRGRVVRGGPHGVKGSIKTVLARAKGRKQKITLPSIDLKRS